MFIRKLGSYSNFCFAPDGAGGGGDGGKSGDAPAGDKPADGETITLKKADYEALNGRLTKVTQDLDDARLEVFSPEYLEFLNAKKDGKAKGKDDDKGSDKGSENLPDFTKMTPAQIDAYIKGQVNSGIEKVKTELSEQFTSTSKEATAKEVAAFARTHEDFDKIRPVMYGLSLKPEFKDYSLEELYKEAKDYVKKIHGEPTKEEKEKGNRAKGEKPGSGSTTFKKDGKAPTADEAAEEAWKQVVGDEDLPSAD